MKKIEAIIRPEKLDYVREALQDIGCPGMMITEIRGHGKQKGIELEWRVGTYRVDLLPKIKIEIVTEESKVNTIIDTIIKHAETGAVGDGKIFISQIEEVIRIRTSERGSVAI